MSIADEELEKFGGTVDGYVDKYIAPVVQCMTANTELDSRAVVAAFSVAVAELGVFYGLDPAFVASAATKTVFTFYAGLPEYKDHPFIVALAIATRGDEKDEGGNGCVTDEVIH